MTNRLKTFRLHALFLLTLVVLIGCSTTYNDKTSGTLQRVSEVTATSSLEVAPSEEKSGGEMSADSSEVSSVALGEESSLDEYILFALKRSSELKSAFEAYQASLQKSPQVSTLPDPKLNYGYFLKEVETFELNKILFFLGTLSMNSKSSIIFSLE